MVYIMDIENVKIEVSNLEELLNSKKSEEFIEIMRVGLCKVRDSEGHDDDPVKNIKLKFGLLNGEKFNAFRPCCFGKISYSHLAGILKDFGYPVSQSQKGNCIPYQKVANINFERLQELEEIERKYTGKNNKKNNENMVDKKMGNLSAGQKISLCFLENAIKFKEQKLMSIRCSIQVQARLEKLATDYPMYSKSYLLSMLVDLSLSDLGV